MKTKPKVVTVTEFTPGAGALLFWRLKGPTTIDELRDAFVDLKLDVDLLPSAPSPADMLRRAVQSLRSRERIVHSVGRTNGYVLIGVETDGDENVTTQVTMKVKLDQVGRLVVHGGTDEMVNDVNDAFKRAADELTSEDVSAWLATLAKETLDGVALREGGGLYFIPNDKLKELDVYMQALLSCSDHAIYRIPAMAGVDAVKAVLDGIADEASSAISSIEADLASGKYGARGLETRVDITDRVEQKVARYEAALGTKLDTLRDRLSGLRKNLTVGIFKVKQAEESERVA